MKKYVLFVAVLITLTHTIGYSGDNLQDVRAKLERIDKILQKAILDGDYETQLKYFTDDFIIDSPIEPPVRGKKALRDEFNKNEERGVRYHTFNTETEDLWVCGNMVYERGGFRSSISSYDVIKPKGYYGSYFLIWQKQQDNSYKLEYQIYSLDVNPFK